jgi:hypothetical protein
MRLMVTGIDGRVRLALLCGLAVMALAGCQKNDPAGQYTPVSAASVPEPELNLTADRGVPVAPGPPVDPTVLASSRSFASRPDPFALLGPERFFEGDQTTERFLAENNGFVLEIRPEEDAAEPSEPPVFEPLPAWRLSGVIIGNGVMALLDTGRQVHEIRPGMLVPGQTEWRVVAIDSERALMRREPGSNKLPKEFEVTLQGPIGGGLTGGGGGTTNPGGGNRPGQGGGGGGVNGPAGAGG